MVIVFVLYLINAIYDDAGHATDIVHNLTVIKFGHKLGFIISNHLNAGTSRVFEWSKHVRLQNYPFQMVV